MKRKQEENGDYYWDYSDEEKVAIATGDLETAEVPNKKTIKKASKKKK